MCVLLDGAWDALAYRGCVVSECLQVSDIGVDQPPRALDVQAHVVIGSVGDDDPHTETRTRAVRRPRVDRQGAAESHLHATYSQCVTCDIQHTVCLHWGHFWGHEDVKAHGQEMF